MTFILTPTQIAQYHEEGFIFVPASEHGLFNPESLQRWAREVQSWPKEKGKWMPYDEINVSGERQLMRTEKFVDYHPEFDSFLRGKALTGVLNQLSGAPMLLFKDKINYKSARGNGFAAHLDAPAYDHIGEIEHVTANLAVDTATIENGCLEVVPKSHKMDVTFLRGGQIHPEWEAAHEWIAVPMQPGDILFFGSHLAHRSGPNRTEKPRSMIYATYASEADGKDLRERYYEHRRATFPPDHEREPGMVMDWQRYGFAAPFAGARPDVTV
ncbi:PhyH-domain-containing protein [Mollisia scopiformis]|uniref:PhyH-domain-containing protein n=1 Tax=Mollisia scopiformis TaxID=149040 RepID=A0A132BCS8_MOLSC|nr:PhyH-domain-containing protein [Mollisia scopiformis]KUJ10171.1 PhyH-domain-containing protein [Mollisia scopiformis]